MLSLLLRSGNMAKEKQRFFEYEGKTYPMVSGGQTQGTTVSFSSPTVDTSDNTIRWTLTFSNAGTYAFSPSSAVQYFGIPPNRTVISHISGNRYRVRAYYSTSQAASGSIYFILRRATGNFFTDRHITGGITAPTATYSFQAHSTVSIAPGTADNANNRVSWVLTFTNPGTGLDGNDFTLTPSDASIGITGTGNERTVTLDLSRISTATGTGNASFVLSASPFSDVQFTSNLAARTSNSVAYSIVPSATISIAAGSVDIATRSISWVVTFTNIGTGFTADDIVQSPSTATVEVSGTGNERTIKLTIPGLDAQADDASFVIDSDAFSDRRIITSTTGRTSNSVEYNFPQLTARTSIIIGAGVVNTTARTITWPLTFSDAGSGLGTTDITNRMPINAVASVSGTGNIRNVTFTIPGAGATSGTASFILSETAFTDRVITGDVADRTSDSVAYTFGSVVATTTINIERGRVNPSNRTISWLITFSNVGDGFDATDITQTPSNAVITFGGGTSNQRRVILTIPGSSAESGSAKIVISATAFTNRIITSPLTDRTSDTVAYEFVGLPETTISIADGEIDRANRAIRWEATFSNVGQGLTRTDIIPTPSTASVSIEGGSGSDKRFIILSIPGTASISGTASFIINTNAFFDRIITSSLTDRTSNSVDYNFLVQGIPVSPNVLRRPSIVNTALPGDWRVFLNNLNITEYVEEIGNISSSLDYEEPYSFTVAEATLSVSNEDGEFSSLNPNNFFNQAGFEYGFRCPVTIFSGDQFVFFGNILEIFHNEADGTIQINLVDLSSDLNNKDVINLGLDKRIRLKAFDRQSSSESGIYPFPLAVAPPSDESLSGITSAFNQELYFQNKVRFSGELNPRNVTVEDNDLRTEGAYLRELDEPIVEFKAPFRDYSINNIVRKILERYNIDRHHITLPNLEAIEEADFTRIGRVGYEVEAGRKNVDGKLINVSEWHWDGAVTDFTFDPKGVDYLNGGGALAEYQDNLYILVFQDLYRVDVETRTYQNLGSIPIGAGRPAGLASLNDRFFVLTRWELYEIHLGDQITTTKINITGVGVDARGLTPHRGHAVALTARGDELFIGYRQGLTRLEIDGNNARNIDLPVGHYRDIIPEMMVGASTDNLEYFNGRFYFVGRSRPSGFVRDTLYSFEMDDNYNGSNGTITYAPDISGAAMGTYQGQLVTMDPSSGRLIYINSENNEREELDNPTFYFLYSARQQNTFPHLLQYEVLSDTWSIVYRYAQHAEFWNMTTKDYETFYILGNETALPIGDRPHPASYNSSRHSSGYPNTNTIWKYNRSTNAFTRFVDNSNALRPQLAQYYHLGFDGSQNRFGFLPDTRKGILLDPTIDVLYYVYATREFAGIAKAKADGSTEAIMSINLDNWYNECSIGFTIANNTIYMSSTFVKNNESTLKIDALSLGRAPRITRLISTRLTENTAYDESITVSGDPAPNVEATLGDGDTLPTGLTLDNERLYGTPTGIPDTGSTFDITWTAENERGTVSETLSFRVADENAAAPSFNAFTATTLTEGTAYDESITATGTPTPDITSVLAEGTTLPTGMTLDDEQLSGTPTGIPDDGFTFKVTFTATNSEGTAATTITFTVNNA